ncbi:MAG: CBS domain-containing protein, partial [Stackebrandtia sp.]
MTLNPVCVPQDATLVAAASIMRDNDIGAVVITEDGRAAGIATDRD